MSYEGPSSPAGPAAPVTPGTMSKKKVDDRVRILIDNIAHQKHRGIVLLVGDRGREQIVNLHNMISRAQHNSKVNVLWCMKAEPDFGTTGKRGMNRKARLEIKGGMSTEATIENFQTWLSQTQIRFCQYKESHKVLGQTFGMAVLQDFEAITPNVLARTIETVAGGGLVVIMLRAMSSLKQLYTIAMDVHSRYRTEKLRDVVPRFNERFLLSLGDCDTVLCVDDSLNVLPLTNNIKSMATSRKQEHNMELLMQGQLKHEAELTALKNKLKAIGDIGPLVGLCNTMDQAKSVLSLMQSTTEKTLATTCVVTAGRGRGKSAALGISAAGAVAAGYSNIFVTAPSPENLQTFFQFVVKGLVELGYKERLEFDAMQSTNPEFSKCIIRVSIFRKHRQTIQFVHPTDSEKFAQAELLVVDEAAAIPLPVVKKMLGPYLIFLSSTISGYEGTGRSLSMKLVADMRKYNNAAASASGEGGSEVDAANHKGGRSLKEISLKDPIRYGPNDPVEAWLTKLLCLDATDAPVITRSSPHPSSCELFYVNRDALFSYHAKAETMLHNIMSLLVAAHYKNQPNDLQLMSDAPGHHLFVLCGKSAATDDSGLPSIYCVVHACEEGGISKEKLESDVSRGARPSGDLVPYTIAQNYLEEGFAKLSGMRIIRIATNPDFQRSGYGTRALQLLTEYFKGNIAVAPKDSMADAAESQKHRAEEADEESEDEDGKRISTSAPVVPKKTIPALLTPIDKRPYEPLDYLGVSFGVTTDLFSFWSKNGFEPLYLRQMPNDLTGEHSCVMVRPFGFEVQPLRREFSQRFISLCPMSFRELPVDLALSLLTRVDAHQPHQLAAATTSEVVKGVVDPTTGAHVDKTVIKVAGVPQATFVDLERMFTTSDLQRLKLCATAYLDVGVVLDLIPRMAGLYFQMRLFKAPDSSEGVVLSHAQAAVLLGSGLQGHTFDDLAAKSSVFKGIPPQQLRTFFLKALSKIAEYFTKLRTLRMEELDKQIVSASEASASASIAAEAAVTALGGKRARGGDANEEVEERRDAQGNITGLSVKRVEKKVINVDSTLMRDAKSTTFNAGASSSGPKDTHGRAVPKKKILKR